MEIALGMVIVYMIPTIIAMSRGTNVGPVLVINLFLGWTLLFYVIALAMALRDRNPRED